jgi:hypothetical protein
MCCLYSSCSQSVRIGFVTSMLEIFRWMPAAFPFRQDTQSGWWNVYGSHEDFLVICARSPWSQRDMSTVHHGKTDLLYFSPLKHRVRPIDV